MTVASEVCALVVARPRSSYIVCCAVVVCVADDGVFEVRRAGAEASEPVPWGQHPKDREGHWIDPQPGHPNITVPACQLAGTCCARDLIPGQLAHQRDLGINDMSWLRTVLMCIAYVSSMRLGRHTSKRLHLSGQYHDELGLPTKPGTAASAPPLTTPAVRPVSGFVTRDGTRLMLEGSEWFFGGTNWCAHCLRFTVCDLEHLR